MKHKCRVRFVGSLCEYESTCLGGNGPTALEPGGVFGKILVPLDGSRAAEAALEQASYLASIDQGKVHLVHAMTDSRLTEDPAIRLDVAERREMQDRSQAASYLDSVKARLQAQGVQCQSHILDAGNPAQQILEFASAESIDLIVLTSHGRSGLSRFLLGSIAEKVMRHASCLVLVVRRNP